MKDFFSWFGWKDKSQTVTFSQTHWSLK